MNIIDHLRHVRGAPPEMVGSIRVSLQPDDPPEFKRVYKAPLPEGAEIEITMYTSVFGRTDRYGTLTQKNGKYILFNVHAVADKIIDRELSPIVQKLTDEILELDREFIKSQPAEFTDTHGTRWTRAK